jgi:hypothetical protein
MLLQAQGDLAGARPYYERALAIWQERRDHHREGAAFFQLGRLALQFNHPAGGARLVALHYLIDRQFGHPDTEQAWRTLTQLAAYLGWSQAALDTTLQEVAAAYRADEGRDLLAAAFADTPAAQERRTGRAATAAGAGGRYHKRRIKENRKIGGAGQGGAIVWNGKGARRQQRARRRNRTRVSGAAAARFCGYGVPSDAGG